MRKAKEYSSSLKMYEQGFKLEQKNKVHLYNAACSAALAGKKKKAFSLLESSVENGYTRLSHLQQDPDLKSLRGEPQWQELVNQVQKKADALEKELDKPLQAQLLQIHQTDQQYRKQMDSVQKSYGTNSTQMQELQQKTRKQDSINLAKVKAILDQHGWVGPQEGRPGSQQYPVLSYSA